MEESTIAGLALGELINAVNGFLADHANMKLFFAFAVLMSALLNIGMGFSTVVAVSALLWGLNGWFQSFGAPAGVVAVNRAQEYGYTLLTAV